MYISRGINTLLQKHITELLVVRNSKATNMYCHFTLCKKAYQTLSCNQQFDTYPLATQEIFF